MALDVMRRMMFKEDLRSTTWGAMSNSLEVQGEAPARFYDEEGQSVT